MRGFKQLHLKGAVVILFLSACSGGLLGPTATPTQDTPATNTAQAELDLKASETARAVEEASKQATQTQSAADQQGTAAAEAELNAAATAAMQATEQAGMTETAQAKETKTAAAQASKEAATSTAVAFATEQAAPISLIAAQLAEEKVITTAEWEFIQLPAYENEWAQLGWYNWSLTGLRPKNFILRTDSFFETASNTADWYVTGCGFVFHVDGDDHYLAYLGMDGYVYLFVVKNGNWGDLGRRYYGLINVPKDQANLMLVVEEEKIFFYVNDRQILKAQDTSLSKGDLGLTLLSGTNKDFGTRCKLTNIDLWVLP